MDYEHVEKVAALGHQLADAEQHIEALCRQLPSRRNMLRLGGAAALGGGPQRLWWASPALRPPEPAPCSTASPTTPAPTKPSSAPVASSGRCE